MVDVTEGKAGDGLALCRTSSRTGVGSGCSRSPCRSYRLLVLVGRSGDLGGVRVGRRLDDEDDAAVELCTRLVAPGGAVHETRLAVGDGLDERRIDTLAGDVRLHGMSAMLREHLV